MNETRSVPQLLVAASRDSRERSVVVVVVGGGGSKVADEGGGQLAGAQENGSSGAQRGREPRPPLLSAGEPTGRKRRMVVRNNTTSSAANVDCRRVPFLLPVAAVLQPLEPVRDLHGHDLVLRLDQVQHVHVVHDVACSSRERGRETTAARRQHGRRINFGPHRRRERTASAEGSAAAGCTLRAPKAAKRPSRILAPAGVTSDSCARRRTGRGVRTLSTASAAVAAAAAALTAGRRVRRTHSPSGG